MSDMLLKAELEGYETTYVLLPAKNTKARGDESMRFAPDLLMKRAPKTVSLGEVQVKATKIKFYNKGDTLVFNADAFQLSEGSMLDGLIRQLPGVELKDDGRIYVNGKYVESLLLNGEVLRLGDIAKIELGRVTYGFANTLNGHPSTSAIVFQTAGSNATQIIKDCLKVVDNLKKELPAGTAIAISLSNNFLH